MKKYRIRILLAALAVVVIAYYGHCQREKGRHDFVVFYNANLDGKIVDVSANVNCMFFNLDNSDVRYGFFPRPADKEHYISFFDSAKIGDRIIKPAKSDTLKLIKGDRVYYFNFVRVE